MAVIAALMAIVTAFGHLTTTEEVVKQQKASDQWSYYQAKSIRRYESEIARDLFAAIKPEKSADYAKNIEKYRSEGEEIQKEARKLEEESHIKGNQARWLHFGEIFLEIGIVFASLAILTKQPLLYWTAVLSSAIGAAIAAATFWIH